MSFLTTLRALKAKYGYPASTPTGGTASNATPAVPVTAAAPDPTEPRTVLIDGYPIDITNSETHDWAAEVTAYPREKGADATDHVHLKPFKLVLDCVVSDTPIGRMATHDTRANKARPSSAMYQRLMSLRDSGKPITVATSLGVFDNMVVSDIAIPRESAEPYQLHFKVDFVQATIVENERTTIRVATPPAQGPMSLGERLAQLSVERLYVWTSMPRDATYKSEYAIYSGLLILTDKNGDRHYQIIPHEVTHSPDGYVDKDGYHPFYGNPAGPENYDPSTGTWRNAKGDVTKAFVADNAPETVKGWSDLVQQQGDGKGPLVPAYGSQQSDSPGSNSNSDGYWDSERNRRVQDDLNNF